ncbi:MAG TPA: ATPase, T2SS/T4P/T4SS family, partial [Tepidisphaeraceae bacterium]|nr:ATPase, T2SS/T4P/T4SS family [Tepidisphaeraceae bacterium]
TMAGSIFLEVQTPQGTRQVPIGSSPVSVGRLAENRIVLSDTMCSRNHAVIEPTPDGVVLRDLGSRNGTRLNGQPVKAPTLLRNGDVVAIGAVRITYNNPEEVDELDALVDNLEELSDADIVEEGDDLVPIDVGGDAVAVTADAGSYESVLQTTADSMADKPFGEHDIALVNTRGQTTTPAGPPSRKTGRRETIDLLRLLLLVVFRSRATDIHVEPKNEYHQVRLRCDGIMVDTVRLPNEIGIKVMSVIKILCDIDLTQRSAVQEGSFSTRVQGRRVDYRVSLAPSVYGQKLVVRVLDTANSPLRIKDLALTPAIAKDVSDAIEQESGMVLVCGPTGSGKTTTLYALIRSIDTNQRNVVTIEDPVEIQIENVTQLPVDDSQGRNFSTLLRSVLRQDPDVILVGEVRDAETARIAMQASITGHLVFSTVHTKDTAGTVFRLLDLGVEPYLISQGLHVVVGQRLARNLCPYCKRATKPTGEQLERMGKAGEGVTTIFEPGGCPRCMGTGYAGRRAFFEVLTATDQLRDVVMRNPTINDIRASLDPKKFVPLGESGFRLVADGVVAFDEVEKAVGK